MLRRIITETNAMQPVLFLSGSRNFRYDINPEYKANRKDTPKPKHLNLLREHCVVHWKASVADGVEADDLLGIEQTADPDNTVICSIDKDLLQIPGRHYNFVKLEHSIISPLQGLRHFYYQLIMGDRADNIFGFDGKARSAVPKFLQEKVELLDFLSDEIDMYNHVLDMYNNDSERMHMNAKCLWILRKENEHWQVPQENKET